jgi:Na+/H+ antiporter NhaD/arsenite permease-like protein
LLFTHDPVHWKETSLDLAWLSLLALVLTVLVSCTTTVNAGFVAIALAWVIGVYLAPLSGQSIGLKGVVTGFPSELFLTLAGVTLLFSLAQVNGTLHRVAQRAVLLCRGKTGAIPLMFFCLALVLASVGAGNIAAAALIAPMAMAVASQAGIPAFLMVIMVAHGAVAGALSPFSPTGIIASGLMNRMGLVGLEWQTYANNLLANAVVAIAGYSLFGGGWLFARKSAAPHVDKVEETERRADQFFDDRKPDVAQALNLQHWLTLSVTFLLIVAVIFFETHIGMGAFAGAVLLILMRAADEREAVRAMPWAVILMVCGVTVLTSLLEKTGGLDLFTTLLAKFASQQSVTGVIALVTGLISVYSSTSGVVLPTFLPSVPLLIEKLGGGDPAAIASSINIGGHLVDVSPLSTIGALCVASAAVGEDRRLLFNKVLAWGLSMAVVGALICYLFFGLLS